MTGQVEHLRGGACVYTLLPRLQIRELVVLKALDRPPAPQGYSMLAQMQCKSDSAAEQNCSLCSEKPQTDVQTHCQDEENARRADDPAVGGDVGDAELVADQELLAAQRRVQDLSSTSAGAGQRLTAEK